MDEEDEKETAWDRAEREKRESELRMHEQDVTGRIHSTIGDLMRGGRSDAEIEAEAEYSQICSRATTLMNLASEIMVASIESIEIGGVAQSSSIQPDRAAHLALATLTACEKLSQPGVDAAYAKCVALRNARLQREKKA